MSDAADTAADASPRLRERDWPVGHSHEDGDLVALFFEPLLARARLYQRVTGYFSGHVFAMAARGVDALLCGGGRMQMVVGCTLEQEEVAALERGYSLRELLVQHGEKRLVVEPGDDVTRERLGWLAWLVAHGHLDLKIGIPKDDQGRYSPALGLMHAKQGLVTDAAGDRLLFNGSINETEAGWRLNRESFSISCDWWSVYDRRRVEQAAEEFQKLWENRARTVEVVDFPEALRQRLLQFLPDEAPRPPMRVAPRDENASDVTNADADAVTTNGQPAPSDRTGAPAGDDRGSIDPAAADAMEWRRQIWSFLAHAAARPDGALVAVKSSTITPWPHQLRAYDRMLRSWPCRLLVADEVGLGKTIEAGLLIRHAWLCGLARRILLLVPKGVLGQWQSELYEKFNLRVPIYTGSALRQVAHHGGPPARELETEIARDAWVAEPFLLTSSHLVRRTERQGELLAAQPWDLVIVDEAHHARRKGVGGTKARGPNQLLALLLQMQERKLAKGLLLLTATPMQVHPVEIFDLLALLGIPAEWSEGAFLNYFEQIDRDPDVAVLKDLAALFRATERDFGPMSEPELANVTAQLAVERADVERALKALREPQATIPLKKLTNDQRRAAFALLRLGSPVHRRMSRHTRSLLRRYFQAGLLDEPITERDPQDQPIDLSTAERAVYEAVESYISQTYQRAETTRRTAVGFVMTIYRRRLASSFHALRRTLEGRLEDLVARRKGRELGRLPGLEDATADETGDEAGSDEEAVTAWSSSLQDEEEKSIQELLQSVGRLGGNDTKARALVDELESAQAAGYPTAIVFTQFTDTMDFLKEYLAERIAHRIGCYRGAGGEWRDRGGNWQRCSKEEIKRRLKHGEIDVLLATDSAGEGLNLQSVGMLVNYDLPWNPMKVEQRIGRIDRIGQKHAKLRIVNYAYRDTVEADVYFALSQRIQLFTGVVGKLQPILSRLPREFEAATLAPPEQRERMRHEMLARVDAMVQEAEESGFDIDALGEAELEPPKFPESSVLPEDARYVLRQPELLPPGVECKDLGDGTFNLRIPGSAMLRVTAMPAVFDDHEDNVQLLLPDGAAFRKLGQMAGADRDVALACKARSLGELLAEWQARLGKR